MTEKPIIFNGAMVRALLEGRKTMTRRIPQRRRASLFYGGWTDDYVLHPENAEWRARDAGYAVGDRLWVRETCRAIEQNFTNLDGVEFEADKYFEMIGCTIEAADDWLNLHSYRNGKGLTVPPIHMPRWASRLTLAVTAVKVERLQDISEEDAIAEGVERFMGGWRHYHFHPDATAPSAKDSFQSLWQSLNAKRAPWDSNPWVVAITFERVN